MEKETLEEVAERFADMCNGNLVSKYSFITGAKWQAGRMYSEEEVLALVNKRDTHTVSNLTTLGGKWLIVELWFDRFKKK